MVWYKNSKKALGKNSKTDRDEVGAAGLQAEGGDHLLDDVEVVQRVLQLHRRHQHRSRVEADLRQDSHVHVLHDDRGRVLQFLDAGEERLLNKAVITYRYLV